MTICSCGIDVVDGTAVLDVRPYTPELDVPVGDVTVPAWVGALTY